MGDARSGGLEFSGECSWIVDGDVETNLRLLARKWSSDGLSEDGDAVGVTGVDGSGLSRAGDNDGDDGDIGSCTLSSGALSGRIRVTEAGGLVTSVEK